MIKIEIKEKDQIVSYVVKKNNKKENIKDLSYSELVGLSMGVELTLRSINRELLTRP